MNNIHALLNGYELSAVRPMNDFDWNLLKSFLGVLDAGSLSAASRKLAVSQPTLGRHITELEAGLGVTLFERGREGLLATPAAIAIADRAREIDVQTGALALAAAGKSAEIAGTIRITASEVVATYLLPDILWQLLETEPDLEIELVPSNDVQNLLRRDADIAVRMVEPAQLDLVTRKVNAMTMGVFAHRDYLARHGTPQNEEDLLGHVIVGYDRSDLIIRGFRDQGIEVTRHFFRLRTDNQITAWELVCAGCGIGFGPNPLAATQPDLVRLEFGVEIPSLPMWLVTHREVRTSARIRKVYDFLADRLAALPL